MARGEPASRFSLGSGRVERWRGGGVGGGGGVEGSRGGKGDGRRMRKVEESVL